MESFAPLEDTLQLWGEDAVTSSRWRPGMPLDILQGTGHLPPHIALGQNISGAEVRNPGIQKAVTHRYS